VMMMGEDMMDNDDRIWSNTLSVREIGEMRVRDIKRRLQRAHGYSAEDVGRMLDKQELIHALGMEEHKVREARSEKQKRTLVWRSILAAVISVAAVACWPVLCQAYQVAEVNLVVYTDRKRLQVRRCWELRSMLGLIGVALMFLLDGLSIWLSASILLSWFFRSRYFFPMPSLPIHPAKFMGGEIAQGPMANYGLNIGPMIISWGLRFGNAQIEKWTGKALASAQRELKRRARENETVQAKEERRARKAARRAAKEAAAKEEAAAREVTPTSSCGSTCRESHPFEPSEKAPLNYSTSPASVEAFLGEEFGKANSENDADESSVELEATSGLDDLD
jgi:ABC-type multidrug transport system fused ATPase/permease subunit